MITVRRILIGLSIPVLVVVLAGAVRVSDSDSPDRTLRDLKVFSETLTLVSHHYVESVDFRQLERGTYQGLAESLDPWSSYFDPVRMKPLLSRDRSGDLGMLLMKHPQQYVRVADVVPGSPAALGGIIRGQFLETIDGLESKDLTLMEAQAMLAGPGGSTVKIGFFRGSDEDPGKVIELTRKDLTDLRVVVEHPEPKSALVRVTDTRPGIAALVRPALAGIKAGGIDSLVLDLRDNSGGTPEDAAELAGLFVGPGPLFLRQTAAAKTPVESRETPAWTGKLVVLVARGTLGEAELVADALRAKKAVPLIGQPTFGKSTQQDLFLLDDGSGLTMSVAEYRRADGSAYDAKGLEPDEKVLRKPLAATEGDDVGEAGDDRSEDTIDEMGPASGASQATGAVAPKPLPGVAPKPAPAPASAKPPKGATGPTVMPAAPEPDGQLDRALEILHSASVKKAA